MKNTNSFTSEARRSQRNAEGFKSQLNVFSAPLCVLCASAVNVPGVPHA